jgi:Domain of unknown function (DUF4136)
MKKLSVVWMALLLMIAYSAFAQDVRFNFDKNTDFSKFKTYKWVVLKDAAPVNDILDKDIKSSVDAQLATKGLSKVDSDNADLFIAYQTAVSTEELGFESVTPGFYRVFFRDMEIGELNVEELRFRAARRVV